MRLSASDSILRGLVNLRANWELVPVQLVQIFLVAVLVLVGCVPPLAVVGVGDLDFLDTSVEDWSLILESVSEMVARGREAWVLLLTSLLVSFAIWLMAGLVYCFFQGGIFGVLMAGDRQAPHGKPQGWLLFRTFSMRDLRGWGARYLWRYFWLINLFLLIMTVWLLLPFLLILLTVWGEANWGMTAALGIGCGGAVPLLFSGFVLGLWANLAQADLARESSSVLEASRQGLRVLGRRLGAVILLTVLGVAISLTLAIATAVAATFVEILTGSGATLQLAGNLVVTVVEWVLGSVFGVAFMAVLVALVGHEAPQELSA